MRQKWSLLLIAGLLLVFFAPATAPRLSYGALFGSGQFQGEHAPSGDGGVRRYATGTYNPAARTHVIGYPVWHRPPFWGECLYTAIHQRHR